MCFRRQASRHKNGRHDGGQTSPLPSAEYRNGRKITPATKPWRRPLSRSTLVKMSEYCHRSIPFDSGQVRNRSLGRHLRLQTSERRTRREGTCCASKRTHHLIGALGREEGGVQRDRTPRARLAFEYEYSSPLGSLSTSVADSDSIDESWELHGRTAKRTCHKYVPDIIDLSLGYLQTRQDQQHARARIDC